MVSSLRLVDLNMDIAVKGGGEKIKTSRCKIVRCQRTQMDLKIHFVELPSSITSLNKQSWWHELNCVLELELKHVRDQNTKKQSKNPLATRFRGTCYNQDDLLNLSTTRDGSQSGPVSATKQCRD